MTKCEMPDCDNENENFELDDVNVCKECYISYLIFKCKFERRLK